MDELIKENTFRESRVNILNSNPFMSDSDYDEALNATEWSWSSITMLCQQIQIQIQFVNWNLCF